LKTLLVIVMIVCCASLGSGQRVGDSTKSDTTPDSSDRGIKVGWLTVHSLPEGAEVFDGAKRIGVTPIDSLSVQEGIHVLRLFYPNVRFWNPVLAVDTVIIGSSKENVSRVLLESPAMNASRGVSNQTAEFDPNAFSGSFASENSKEWIAYTAGATMVLSGALSAYLKTNSDNDFAAYVANPDPNVLSRVHRLDTWAGVSLFVSEISFGVLTYLLLTEL
jgi:hypothetical protein